MLYSIEEINQALLATYTLHVQETPGPTLSVTLVISFTM